MIRIPPASAMALTALLLPGAALAQCPTADDLAAGIRFTGEQGETEVFTALDDTLVRAAYRSPDGLESDAVLAHGLYLVELISQPGSAAENRSLYAYPVLAREMPMPQSGGSWEVDATVTVGEHSATEQQAYSFGVPERVSFGDCTYEVIPVEVTYSTMGDTVETYHYVPDLGLAYFAAVSSELGDHVYPYISIEALR